MNEKKKLMKYSFTACIAMILLVGFDQWTKLLALRYLANHEDIVLIPGVLRLHYLENRGAAFGLLQNKQGLFIIMAVLFFIVACFAFWRLPKTKRYLPLHIIAVCVTAGGIGNVIDRLRLNFVVDFIYFSLIDFPVFNVADIYVTVSGVLLVILVCFFYKEEDFSCLERKERKRSGDN